MANERFIRFDEDIWSLREITVLQKLILNHIRSFEDKGLQCFTKVETLSDLYGVEYAVAREEVLDLVKQKYISIYNDGQHTFLQIIWNKPPTTEDFFNGVDIFEV